MSSPSATRASLGPQPPCTSTSQPSESRSTTRTSGYWLAFADGEVVAFGDTSILGQPGIVLNAPIVEIGSTDVGDGFRLVGADGGVFCYGNASFQGSMGGSPLNAPVVGMASTG